MQLNYKTYGQGEPLIILHGLFGMLDNWQSIAKKLADHFLVILIDQRNHGKSPHSEEIDYELMAGDLKEFMESNWIFNAHLLGHSMGGKTVMQFAMQYPDMVKKLVVVDIGVKEYPEGHIFIFDAMRSLDVKNLKSRSEAEKHLFSTIKNKAIVQFLMKNLSRNKEGGYKWKMNLNALYNHYDNILAAVSGTPFEKETLFLRGETSPYIRDEDIRAIQLLFPNSIFKTISNTGHWVHAEAPKQLIETVLNFLNK